VPVAAAEVADSVSVVLHVAVQVVEENAAVTPAGREEAPNETETALPVTKVAVMPSVTELPCTTETAGDAALSEMLDDTGAAVVNVKSDESVVPLDELVEPAAK